MLVAVELPQAAQTAAAALAGSAAAAAEAGPPPLQDGEWHLSPAFRRNLGLQLIVLGAYGAFVIYRVRKALLLKQADEALASLRPLELPLQARRRATRQAWLEPSTYGPAFCGNLIC